MKKNCVKENFREKGMVVEEHENQEAWKRIVKNNYLLERWEKLKKLRTIKRKRI